MSRSARGMEPLILAERRSNELINDAKRRKVERMKLAKEEALLEIERFRKECDSKFQDQLRDQDDISAVKAYAEELKTEKLKEMHKCFEEKKEIAVDEIIQCIKAIEPKLSRNFEP